MAGKVVPDFLDVLDEELRVAVGDVDADELHFRNAGDDTGEKLEVGVTDPGTHKEGLQHVIFLVHLGTYMDTYDEVQNSSKELALKRLSRQPWVQI